MHNCLTNPIDKLLAEGFTTRQTDVRPASSVNTAMQLVAVIFQLQSLQQFGGVSASHLDWSMVPYVRLSFMKHYNEICDTIPGCSKMAIELTKEECKEISINDSLYTGGKYNLIRRRIHEIAIRRTNKEIHQAVEGLYHNLNTLQSRSGNQLPFSSINYGTCTLPEGRMVIKLLLDVSLEGLGKYGVTSIFPCGIFQYKKGVNDKPGTPNYDMFRLALKSTAQRIYPNYANCDWSVNSAWVEQDRKERQEYLDSLSEYEKSKVISIIDANITKKLGIYVANDNLKVIQEQQPIELFSTMGCRTVNGSDVNALDVFKSNIQKLIKGQTDNLVDYYSSVIKDGRGNICPVTIILPKLAMESKIKVEDSLIEQAKVVSDAEKEQLVFGAFMELLEVKIGEAKDMLIERFNWICSQSAASARFMYDNVTMSGYVPEEGIKSALKHGTIVIGQIGLAETLQIMFGCNHTTERGMEYAKKIEQLYKDKCAEYKKEYKLNFGVYYTPAESLCYTAMNKFVQQYGIIPNVSDKEYFTNSIHVPVWEQVNMFEKIDIESQLTGYSSAGCITYVELPSSAKHNIDALEQVVTYAMNKDIPYFAINVPIDNCCDCHYSDEIGNECPKCGGKTIKRLRRVTGYLSTTVEHFNAGKQAEVRDRTKHTSMDC